MTAPLQLSSGSAALPSLTFGTDTDTGAYRVGANELGLAAGGVLAEKLTATGAVFPLVATTQAGITATQSTANGAAMTATGNGTGAAVSGTGGASNGTGLSGTGGATNGIGVLGQGAGTGTGVRGVGGASAGDGVAGVGGTGGVGVRGTGAYGVIAAGTGFGVFAEATDASGIAVDAVAGAANGIAVKARAAGAGGIAIEVGAGHAKFTGADPASTAGFSDTLTPMNLVKAWAVITVDGAGAVAINNGFNAASVSLPGGNVIRLTFATAMGTATYGVWVTPFATPFEPFAFTRATGSVDIKFANSAGAIQDPAAVAATLSVMVMGAN